MIHLFVLDNYWRIVLWWHRFSTRIKNALHKSAENNWLVNPKKKRIGHALKWKRNALWVRPRNTNKTNKQTKKTAQIGCIQLSMLTTLCKSIECCNKTEIIVIIIAHFFFHRFVDSICVYKTKPILFPTQSRTVTTDCRYIMLPKAFSAPKRL